MRSRLGLGRLGRLLRDTLRLGALDGAAGREDDLGLGALVEVLGCDGQTGATIERTVSGLGLLALLGLQLVALRLLALALVRRVRRVRRVSRVPRVLLRNRLALLVSRVDGRGSDGDCGERGDENGELKTSMLTRRSTHLHDELQKCVEKQVKKLLGGDCKRAGEIGRDATASGR